ncbi:aliphatic sulfonates family ABC transporter, periplasmic ligand-binding protein [Stanieria cyanosphaera PCC 7437]|uniref:Aliphatic sulfonates family ABC transporter, periplasmic ligand-binding protein n=1 Tax=Stanieria cyanosphaera (strain ATCC 29371 / PCC 7437) TaxID=111780 RepID=K9XPZ4_STAC7|nr:ABC transporter substrate-binding protein [Stanieria cyanosphaera]AFZ34583.1 aliphatic sulfonates family ABC transporter, periplasmic ligand-binding protein [Stanieria cyanosphaera PCC 7437]
MLKTRSFLSYLILFIFSLSVVVGCNPATSIKTTNDTGSTSSGNTASVSLGYSAWPGWFPWQVTQEQGIFQANNASVELKWFDGYLESINALNAQQITANSQTLNDTISAIAGGAEQVIVLVNDNSTGNDKIIVREGINSIADLKGKKVAAEEGTVDHYLLLLGLEQEGLSPEDIEFIPLETGQAATAFVGGQVDAVAVFAPFTTQALKRNGSKELFSSKDFPGAISDHLVFTRQFVEENPEQVQAVVNSWFATLDYMEPNQAQAYEIMARRANVTVEEYQDYAEGTTIFSVEDNLKAFQPGNDASSLQYSAQQISDFLVKVGLAPQVPDTSQLFDDRFVKAYAEKAK